MVLVCVVRPVPPRVVVVVAVVVAVVVSVGVWVTVAVVVPSEVTVVGCS